MMISTEMSQFLSTMDYPAHRHDLVREAAREGLNATDMARLAEVTPRSYSGKLDVMLELRWRHGGLLEPLHSPLATPA